MAAKKRIKKPDCIKGYSCGYGCISVKLQCRTDGLKGQSVKLVDNYFKKASGKSSEPDYTNLKDEDSIGSGAFGMTWLVGDKIVKRYSKDSLDDVGIGEFKKANELINNTLAKDGVMPKVTKLPFKGDDGNWYSEQEALIGYKTAKELKKEGFEPKNDYNDLLERIKESLVKHGVLHGDIHSGNQMLKLDDEGNVIDIKLIDGDFATTLKDQSALFDSDEDLQDIQETEMFEMDSLSLIFDDNYRDDGPKDGQDLLDAWGKEEVEEVEAIDIEALLNGEIKALGPSEPEVGEENIDDFLSLLVAEDED